MPHFLREMNGCKEAHRGRCLSAAAHFTWLRLQNQTDRLSQGQELVEPWQEAGDEWRGCQGCLERLRVGGKDSENIPWIHRYIKVHGPRT